MRVRRTVELVVAVALAVLAFGAVGGAAAAAPVMFRELDAGSRAANIAGEPKSDAGVVLRSAAAARSRMRAWGLDSTAVGRVDFKRKSLVAVLADYQPSGGYRARVRRVDVRGGHATVTAAVRYEGGDLATADLERPWVLVAVDRRAVAKVRGAVRIVRG